jgi:hypothetical protein
MLIPKIIKTMLILVIASPFFSSKSSSVAAERLKISFDSDKRTISADIKQASLESVIEKIGKEKGIWVKGSQYLSGKIISVEFEDLSIKEAMTRILYELNHSLMFDQKGKLLGVIMVRTDDSKWRRSSIAPRRKFQRRSRRR